MNEIAMILGVGGVCFLILYLINILQEKKHELLKLFLLFMFATLLMLIPKVLSDNSDYCEIVLNETQEIYIYGNNYTGYHWDYDILTGGGKVITDVNLFHKNITNTYDWYCHPNNKVTTSIFFNAVVWFLRIFWVYVFCYMVYYFYKSGHKYISK